MATIYKIVGGGQRIRQKTQGKNNIIQVEIHENSDYPEKCQCSGQDSYTQEMWSTDLETLQRWANDWAGKEIKLTFKTVLENAEQSY